MINQEFEEFYANFMKSEIMRELASIKEDSPWHREDSIKEHTRMCVDWFMTNLSSSFSQREKITIVLALLFHDTGKPMARTEKFSESRGVYYSYPGHEQFSARIFEDYYLNHVDEYPFNILVFPEIMYIKHMIEYHLPYELTKEDKLCALKTHFNSYFQYAINFNPECFYAVLLSDAHGRISDDQDATYTRVDDWIAKFKSLPVTPTKIYDNDQSILFVMVGASGSGKSSSIKSKFYEKEDVVFGLDICREAFYKLQGFDGEYADAFKYCVDNEKEFNQYVTQEWNKVLKSRKNIYLDNTNTSRKNRRRWINEARQKGYWIQGMEMVVKLDTAIARQSTRSDKNVPIPVVKKQYYGISSLMIGTEVDGCWNIDGGE